MDSDYEAIDYACDDPGLDADCGSWKKKDKKDEKKRRKKNRRGLRLGELFGLPPVKWLVEDHFPEQSFATLVGMSGSCKTFVALDYALSIAYGLSYLGRHKVKQGPVAYIISEGVSGIGNRVKAWMAAKGVTEITEDFLVIPASFDLTDEGEVEEVVEIIRDTLSVDPVLIVVDTLARNFGGDENSTKDMNSYVACVDSLKDEFQSTVLSVHHTGRDATKKERGSSALRAAADTVIILEKEKGGRNVTVKCDKQKDSEEFRDYTLARKLVTLDNGDTNLVMVSPAVGRYEHVTGDTRALMERLYGVFGGDSFSYTDGHKASGIKAKTTWTHSLKNLQNLHVVRKEDDAYRLTDGVVMHLAVTFN